MEHDSTNYFAVQSEPPSLSEVRRAVPARSSGAPVRCASHKDAILALLRERGAAGILSSELYDAPERYGRSPRNRISELRADGCLIETKSAGAAIVRYVLLRDSNGAPPRENPPRTESRDWYERQTGKPRAAVVPAPSTADDLPLFSGVR